MKIYALVDEDYEGSIVLYLSENKQSIENKKLSIELENDKRRLIYEEYELNKNQAAIKAGFTLDAYEELYSDDNYAEWEKSYYETNPYPDLEEYNYIFGNLVIKEYETI